MDDKGWMDNECSTLIYFGPNKQHRPQRAYLSALVSEELPCVVNNLLVCQVGVRLLLTDAQHLPQCDSERPHVAGCGELPLETQRRAGTQAGKNKKYFIYRISLSCSDVYNYSRL